MQLAILAAVLAALAHEDNAALPPVSGLAWRLLLAATSVLIAPLAALLGSQRLAQRIANDDEEERQTAQQARLQSAVIGLWLCAVAVMLFVARWPQIVRSNWSLADWPLVDELAILTPVIAPLILLWAAFYRLERAGQVAAFRQRGLEPPPARLLNYLWLNARYHLGLVLLPALFVVGGQDLLALAHIDVGGSGSSAWWFGLPLVVTMLFLTPLAVRRIWRTSPLPAGPLRDELAAICLARRCGLREMLVWHTDGYVANAAVVGLSRWLRYVLLTDGLIARLSTAEIAAVLRHELGHIRRRHLPLRLALLALPLAWWLAIQSQWPSTEETIKQVVAAIGIPTSLLATAIVPLAMLAYAVIVVGWYSRLVEHEADLEACTSDAGQLDPQYATDFCRALSRLIGGGSDGLLSRWLHPGLHARLTLISKSLGQPQRAIRFHARMRWIAVVIVALYIAALVLSLA